MRVLVTGSQGFVGRRLVASLLGRGDEVVGTGRSPATAPEQAAFRYVQADIADANAMGELSRDRFDAVVHLAAPTTHAEIVDDPTATLRSTVSGMLNVCEVARAAGARRLVYASTGKVYGREQRDAIGEDVPPTPRNVLGKVKHVAEQVLAVYAEHGGPSAIAARIFNVYGAGQRAQFLVPTIVSQVATGPGPLKLGNLVDERDYIHVDDVVSALRCLVDLPEREPFVVRNVGSGVPRSAGQIVEAVGRLVGRELTVEVDRTRFRHDETSVEFADSSRLRADGWSPRMTLEQGLREVLVAAGVAPCRP